MGRSGYWSVSPNGAVSFKAISGTTGTFSGNLTSAGTVQGATVEGTTSIQGGTISGTIGTFSGALTSSGTVQGATVKGTSSIQGGAISGTTGTFSSVLRTTRVASVGGSCSGGEIAASGSDTLLCKEGKFAQVDTTSGGHTCMAFQGTCPSGCTVRVGPNSGDKLHPDGFTTYVSSVCCC
jgi:hypothetical protein